MPKYIFNDEDNTPMMDDAWAGPHNPTVYLSRTEMEAVEKDIPFTDPPQDGCWNCMNFDWKHEACTVNWNNMDESYYNPDCDDRDIDDHCENWELDPDARWEDCHDRPDT